MESIFEKEGGESSTAFQFSGKKRGRGALRYPHSVFRGSGNCLPRLRKEGKKGGGTGIGSVRFIGYRSKEKKIDLDLTHLAEKRRKKVIFFREETLRPPSRGGG